MIAADVTALLGYRLFAVVMMENRFASRTIEVDREQTVVTTGPYAVVRHPMYAAVLILCAASPMALGSYPLMRRPCAGRMRRFGCASSTLPRQFRYTPAEGGTG